MEGKEVICINDNWDTDDPREKDKPAPGFMDKDTVTGTTDLDGRVYYQLKNRFTNTSRFAADHFLLSGQESESEIMPAKEVREHLKQLHIRRQESEIRFRKTLKILALASVVAIAGGIILFKK